MAKPAKSPLPVARLARSWPNWPEKSTALSQTGIWPEWPSCLEKTGDRTETWPKNCLLIPVRPFFVQHKTVTLSSWGATFKPGASQSGVHPGAADAVQSNYKRYQIKI